MSDRGTRAKVCGSKIRHATEDAAWGALRSFQRKHPDYRGMVYGPCPFCGGFHYGHPPRKIRQRMAARRRNAHWSTTLS